MCVYKVDWTLLSVLVLMCLMWLLVSACKFTLSYS
uniref:Uncharacterized protein n=1 Tax=Arundo donax TaxID=35708 RepID=A0A0A9EL59_ARUDO